MLIVKFKSLFLRAALAGGFCMALVGIAAAQVVTTSFQNGMDGYTGTFDRWIGEREQDNQDGSAAANDFMDGYAMDSSPDTQALLRFDNIIGSDPGRFPSG